MRILVTAGPTHEPIDPVRFIGNRSSGKMGRAIANAFLAKGHEVFLVLGPVQIELTAHPLLHVFSVETAEEMFRATQQIEWDIAILSAAVADFTPIQVSDEKIKKGDSDEMTLHLKKTKDILKTLGEQKNPAQSLVGFALETTNELANARQKLKRKNADIIVLNSLNDEGAAFGHNTNKVTLIHEESIRELPLMPKEELGIYLCEEILSYHLTKGKK